MSHYRPQGFSILPPVVKNLLIINGIVFLATMSLSSSGIDLYKLLGLHYPGSELFKPYQIITYMFMHGGISHLFFNMFAVWMFGSAIENYWGPKRFLVYYLLTGIGASVLHYSIVYVEMMPILNTVDVALKANSLDAVYAFMEQEDIKNIARTSVTLVDQYNAFYNSPSLQSGTFFIQDLANYYKNMPNVVGASGSLFGILLAFGMLFPETSLYLMFIPAPIKAKYFVAGYGAVELISGLQNNPNDNVAHFAHLGGMLFGYLLIRYWRANSQIR